MADPLNTSPVEAALAAYARRSGEDAAARQALIDALAEASEDVWLACARALVLHSDLGGAKVLLDQAAQHYPAAMEVAIARAGLALQAQRYGEAEQLLRARLPEHPGHVAATFMLCRALQPQGRLQALADALRQLFDRVAQDADTAIQAIEWLDGIQRPADALHICERMLGSDDVRFHAYAGMLCLQLGRFERVREHYKHVLAHSDRAAEWHVPAGLASLQRYADASDPDFALFRQTLQRADLSEGARASALFALAKAHDDVGAYADAAACLRQANALARPTPAWSRKQWRRLIEARLASMPHPVARPADASWAPLLIVGVPRSGTTLLAAQLARHPQVRNRGELGLLAELARQLEHTPGSPSTALARAAARYATQLRQDDAPARWYIDKQPLNLLHLDLAMTLWPATRVLYCHRNARDTALSLWSQDFHDPAHGYACDLGDCAAVISGCRRLMRHWQACFGNAIRTVRYEELVAAPDACLAGIADWLGLPAIDPATPVEPTAAEPLAISTASHWQARQPVYRHAVARWRHYAEHVPELLQIPDD